MKACLPISSCRHISKPIPRLPPLITITSVFISLTLTASAATAVPRPKRMPLRPVPASAAAAPAAATEGEAADEEETEGAAAGEGEAAEGEAEGETAAAAAWRAAAHAWRMASVKVSMAEDTAVLEAEEITRKYEKQYAALHEHEEHKAMADVARREEQMARAAESESRSFQKQRFSAVDDVDSDESGFDAGALEPNFDAEVLFRQVQKLNVASKLRCCGREWDSDFSFCPKCSKALVHPESVETSGQNLRVHFSVSVFAHLNRAFTVWCLFVGSGVTFVFARFGRSTASTIWKKPLLV
eukprot:gnl/MRDRNA2_/MRDRNA2_170833_c0_seq1.p1 gnl/MRDRNA2_/MRDRNA2_170833_c0~~gnl/MRDRNA2_/MRDRNA2_170833_c0_seq1.p1  ORF type:complete len:299 (-),score=69.08 gnl/MRDRNA2_/MRDRNA2_170833_c0_seq1:20-916(-)